MQIKKRILPTELIDGKQNGLIKIITGIRRCGKSYLLFKLFKQHLMQNGNVTCICVNKLFESWIFSCVPRNIKQE